MLTTCVVALFARSISLPHTADLQHTQNNRKGQPAIPHMQKALQRVYDTVAGLEKTPQEKEQPHAKPGAQFRHPEQMCTYEGAGDPGDRGAWYGA